MTPRPVSEITGSSGCEDVARTIQQRIGGKIYEFKHEVGGREYVLGPYRNVDSEWFNHQFVVKDGYAYDAWTGEQGEPVSQYVGQFDCGKISRCV